MGNREKTIDTTCIQCCHFHVWTASGPYSDVTPGENFNLDCEQGIWIFDDRKEPGEEGSWSTCINSALKCDKFERRDTNAD